MNKKVFVAIIIIILAITAAAFVGLWKSKNGTLTGTGSVKNNSGTVQESGGDTAKSAKGEDSDIKAIEQDLSTINESEFDVSDLSDENIGL